MDDRYDFPADGRGSWYGSGPDGADDSYSSGYSRDYSRPPFYGQQDPSAGYQEEGDARDGLGQWVITLVLCLIPIVGFFYVIFLAVSPNSSFAKKNWARATLIVGAFLLAFLVVFGDPTGTLTTT